MKTLYYTIRKHLILVDTVEECTGWKTINLYEIVLDQPKLWCEIEAKNESNTIEEIQTWLDNNGFENIEYNFELL